MLHPLTRLFRRPTPQSVPADLFTWAEELLGQGVPRDAQALTSRVEAALVDLEHLLDEADADRAWGRGKALHLKIIRLELLLQDLREISPPPRVPVYFFGEA